MGNGGRIRVTVAAIHEAAADVDSTAAQIAEQLADLKAYLGPLTSTWSGDASAEFQALLAKWDGSAADLNQVLRVIAQSLRTARDNYTKAERTNSSIWG